ncbi:MAG: CHAT domain-containing protein [Chloroflexi bacterium]|nr:CHAT domain-containing protein [Chloroflexota bacterium]
MNDEWNRIKTALEPLVQTKEVTVDRLPNFKHPKATQAALLDQLNLAGKKYHVFHFIGHGGFDKQNRPGLAMEGGSDGTGEIVPTKQLAVLVDHFSLRLAILNACEGAKSSPWDAYSGVAQSLVQLGIPAVIAMQFKITDATAILFAGQFYKALATGMTVEDSLNFARKAIWVADNPTEWGTPVLFSQSEDGVLFNIDRPTEEQQREAKIKALVNEAKVAIERQAWDQAIKRLQEIVAEQQSAGGSG